MSSMFCFQCEQAHQGQGCSSMGVCGKDPETAALQDLLVFATKGISIFAHRAAEHGVRDERVDRFILEALFTTVTNVNFDPERVERMLREAAEKKRTARELYERACLEAGVSRADINGASQWEPAATLDELIRQGEQVTIENRLQRVDRDLLGLQEMLTYGLKGMAAYAYHAWVLGKSDPRVAAFIYEALDYLATGEPDTGRLLGLNLRCGAWR